MISLKFIRRVSFFIGLSFFCGVGLTHTQVSSERVPLLSSEITVTPNPYGLAPLTAQASFQTSVKCNVQIRVLGDIEVDKAFEDQSTDHIIPILGLYPGRDNIVLLKLSTDRGAPETHMISIKTDPLPDFLPAVEIITAHPDLMEPGMNLSALTVTLGQNRGTFPIIFDRNGAIRWYLALAQFNGLCAPF
jgi:arylsulfate sulfotransferase